MRRVLFISPEFPYPPTSGGRARSYHLLQAVANWAPTDLLTFLESPGSGASGALAGLCQEVEVIALPAHRRDRWHFVRRNLGRALRGVNPLVDRFNQPALRGAVQRWLEGRDYQVIVVEHSWIAPYIEFLTAMQPAALTVLDAHNVETDLWRQYYQRPRHWWYRPAAYRYFRAMRQIETRFVPAFDVILATSEIDRQRLESFAAPEQLAVVPNGTAVRAPEARPGRTEPLTVGFLGALDYPPNEASAIYLLEEIWPRIVEYFPSAQLLIGGQASSGTVRRIAHSRPGIHLVGHVPQVESFLDRLDVMVVPLRHGSGTRIKILDAWARALPVVSTAKGAEGIEHRDGEDIVIADGAGKFAAAVSRLLRDPALRASIGRRAAERVSAKYSWGVIGQQLTALVEARLAQGRSARPRRKPGR